MSIKICQRCFFCHSLVLCKTCNKCQTCCTKSACRGQTSKLLENLAGSGCRAERCSNPERGLYPSFSDPAKTHKVSHGHKLVCQSPQEQLPAGGITSAYGQKCYRTSKTLNISGVFQPAIFSPKVQQQVDTHTRFEQIESFPQGGEIQNGDTGNHQNIPPTRGVGYLNRFQGRLLRYPYTGTVQEIPEISCPGSDIPIQSTALWSVHSTLGVHCNSKRGETDDHTQGYKDPPVPRRLVGESQIPPGLPPPHPNSSGNMPNFRLARLAGELGQFGTGPKADLRFCRLPVRPQGRSSPTDPRPVAESSGQNVRNTVSTGLSGPAVHVPDRLTNSHGKASSPRLATHEAHTVASQKPLENTQIARKSDSNSQVPAPSFTMVATGRQRSHRPTITSNKACSANVYRCIKRSVGRSLKRTHCQRDLVTARKQAAYKLFETKGSFSSLKRVSRPLCRQDSTCGNRQYYSSVIHKQGRRHEVGHTLCPTMEDLDLVYQTSSNSKSPTYSGSAEHGSRQAIPSGPDHSNRMVPSSRGFPNYMQQVAPSSDRSFCHEVKQQVASVPSSCHQYWTPWQ